MMFVCVSCSHGQLIFFKYWNIYSYKSINACKVGCFCLWYLLEGEYLMLHNFCMMLVVGVISLYGGLCCTECVCFMLYLREFKFARNYFSRSPQCANLNSARIILCEKIVHIFSTYFSKFNAQIRFETLKWDQTYLCKLRFYKMPCWCRFKRNSLLLKFTQENFTPMLHFTPSLE